jgi:hypothetical protein
MRTSIELALLVSSLSLVAACGGKVVFSEGTGGSGGAGGEGGSANDVATSTSDVGTSSVAVTNGSSSSSGGQGLCEDFCTKYANCIGDVAQCIQDCSSSLGQGCDPQFQALVECLDSAFNPQTCAYQGECDQLSTELAVCLGDEPPPPGQCLTEMATGTDASCKASGTCFGTTVTVSCDAASNGSVFCSCFADNVAATCQQPSLDCTLESSCCIGALFGG